MNKIYMLFHSWYPEEGYKSVKIVGIYDTMSELEKNLALLKTKPGFCDAIDGFYIKEYELNQIVMDEGSLQL
ncbi:hypothetical protein O4H49_07670 [Kiloniella laminariae]|uniref:DUF7336 domain-containing protein n=1 Tax=Kiloniella laminariae TaxID=454162 RepID=A0ABT4LHT4_9PROT|nr:hypothetical protein [Kiloniella laminariae]MCZ4280652.1 hypothetical protein [Kiloniella laminariae]